MTLRSLLNKVFSSRVFYMLFSLFVAVALWMYVEYNEYRDEPHKVSNVEVRFRNSDVLRDRGLFMSSKFPETVTLTFECPRSVATKLTNQTLFVEVDLANIKSTGTTSLLYEIIFPPEVDRRQISNERRDVERISLNIDRVLELPVPVTVDYRGGTASPDLMAEAAIYDPQTIIVSGPEEIVSRIKEAFVPIPRVSLYSTYTADLGFMLLDEYGEELESTLLDHVESYPETVRVTIPIRQTKDVPLHVALRHGAGTNEANTKVICEPSFIKVSGDPESLKDFNNVTLGTIDMTRYRDRTTETFSIIIPNNLTNLSGEIEAIVSVEISGLETDYYSTDNLQTSNIPPGYVPYVITRSLDVRIRGSRENLNQISQSNIRAVADLTDMQPGTQPVPARVFVDGADPDLVGAVGEYRFFITLMREPEETE